MSDDAEMKFRQCIDILGEDGFPRGVCAATYQRRQAPALAIGGNRNAGEIEKSRQKVHRFDEVGVSGGAGATRTRSGSARCHRPFRFCAWH